VMRRVRPYFEGTLAKYYDFRLLLDFGQGTATLQDAWADMHYWDEFRLRMGKMKAPTGIERRQDDRYLTFEERALTVNMVPDRDIGGMIHGIFWNKSLEWQLFMGNSVPDNTAAFDLANNDGKDYMGMLFWRPFQAFGGSENTKGFGLGLMGSYGTTRGNVLDTFKSTAQATIFTYNSGVYAVGGRYRIVPHASYYNGPFRLYGEWVENWQEIGRNVTVAGQPQSLTDGISDQSWQISAAYVLTGEDASYTGVKPRHDFNPFTGDWGAFEVAARMDQLLVDRSP